MTTRSKPPESPDPDGGPTSGSRGGQSNAQSKAQSNAQSNNQSDNQSNAQSDVPPGLPLGAARRPTIGIAGGIGSGKSSVARILAELGCIVSDSDADTRAVLADPEVVRTLADWWGPGVLADDGMVDRGRVAAIVFADPEQRARLEGLIHPRLHAMREFRFDAAPASAPAFVIDAPLLFEAGLADQCDAIIFVEVPREIRLARVIEGRGWDADELDRREASQLSLDEKRARADHVILNAGELSALHEQLHALLHDIVSATS